MPIIIVLPCRFGDNRSDTPPETSGRTANVTATSQIQQSNTPAPDANQIRAAVQASQAFASGLLDQLRRDGLDDPGVTRDTYGPGEQRAHATCAKLAETMGLTIERDPAANL
jgi:hypothetical protein